LDLVMRANQEFLPGLEVEITEREFIPGQLQEVNDVLRAWRALGVKIALDDFGTGYSNLAYLRHFELNVLKIDKSFVQGMDSEQGGEIVAAVMQIARSLKLEVVAEGIERPSQLEKVLQHGIAFGQGWLFAAAETPKACIARLSAPRHAG
jgi:sensor c-di-GMP phosphodiesterase-like protein